MSWFIIIQDMVAQINFDKLLSFFTVFQFYITFKIIENLKFIFI